MSNCPIGFTLVKGICDQAIRHFNKALQLNTKCDINNLTISLPDFFASPWLGVLKMKDNTSIFGIARDCPFQFCKPKVYFHSLVFVNGIYMLANLSEHVPICLSHRSRVLCGTCTDSYSVVFGSSGCYKCSDKWLWTILLYAVGGPLLIYLLYALRLTLTAGTLNGIIFYAQAANVGVLRALIFYTDHHAALAQFISIFLSFLNLNLGFPLRFYNGMTELWKTGLSLVFPIYLLTIVVILIILSGYSTWLSNRISHSSVQVLVTVVHLSFSKLLITIIDYEAIRGPYREKRKYWFTARLFLLIIMYVIYTANSNVLTIVITGPIIIIFVLIQGHLKPFRNMFVNILDSSLSNVELDNDICICLVYCTGFFSK